MIVRAQLGILRAERGGGRGYCIGTAATKSPQHYVCRFSRRKRCTQKRRFCLRCPFTRYLSPCVWCGCGGEGCAAGDERAAPLVKDLLCKTQGPQYVLAVCETQSRSFEPKFSPKGRDNTEGLSVERRHALGYESCKQRFTCENQVDATVGEGGFMRRAPMKRGIGKEGNNE